MRKLDDDSIPNLEDLRKVSTECPECQMDTLWQSWSDRFYCCFCPAWWSTREPYTEQELQYMAMLQQAMQNSTRPEVRAFAQPSYILGSQQTDYQGLLGILHEPFDLL